MPQFFETVGGSRFISQCEQFFRDFHKSQTSSTPFDWKTFRVLASKDILCALMSRTDIKQIDGSIISRSVNYADALIAELRKKGDAV